MKPDYLVLKNGTRVRIEWNANSLAMFVMLTGIDLSQLINMKPGIKMLITLAWCAAVEGEAADGNDLAVSELEFGRLMSMDNIVQFSEIFARQGQGSEYQKKSPPPDNPLKVLLRSIRSTMS